MAGEQASTAPQATEPECEEQGYEGLLPVQEKWLNHLMSTPTSQWPEDLLTFIRSQPGPISWDAVTDAVGMWIKMQRD